LPLFHFDAAFAVIFMSPLSFISLLLDAAIFFDGFRSRLSLLPLCFR